ncbi:Endonuclease domain-containing 1 protein [Labeo rohita]|uniref:Endonuclease domain-containing 1 protein n=1 Tax=Labeo rohita TaxID=84645 RepID=A0ABQ8LET6_LABRO|nr:Endonuclease domain-containing 1 protein [Labeo rohita]
MVHENQNILSVYKGNQAISSDYSKTGYDRGHLNPSSFQCGEGRNATFTLTNAAPMKERFNQGHWNRCETKLRTYLINNLARDAYFATAFIVTGTVPDPNVRIPDRGTSEDSKRVTVPSHIWTAVCYKHHTDDTKSHSFGYIGTNQQEEPDIRLMSVSRLNNELMSHFRTNQPINIFADDCFGIKTKLAEVQAKIEFGSTGTCYNVAEDLKIDEEILFLNFMRSLMHDVLRKIKVSVSSDAVECLLKTENQKTAADGSLCLRVSESDYSCRCDTGKETKLCCSTPCLYMEKISGYRCYSDQKLIECSPPYSLITVNGERCKNDFPCATYYDDYYWGWTSYSPYYFSYKWDYCSPLLRSSKAKNGQHCHINHACAKYGKNKP